MNVNAIVPQVVRLGADHGIVSVGGGADGAYIVNVIAVPGSIVVGPTSDSSHNGLPGGGPTS